MKSFIIRFSETIFEESEHHTYEMEYEEPKNDGMRVKVPGVKPYLLITAVI